MKSISTPTPLPSPATVAALTVKDMVMDRAKSMAMSKIQEKMKSLPIPNTHLIKDRLQKLGKIFGYPPDVTDPQPKTQLKKLIPKKLPKDRIINLLDVFGYPPDSIDPRTTTLMKKSMPVVQFYPSIPQFQHGLHLFTLKPAWKQYAALLATNKFSVNSGKDKGIQLAFLADNFPTDTFTNEYGENILQKFTDIASEGAASISQMFGAEKATDVFNNIGGQFKMSDNLAVKMAGKGMESVSDTVSAAMSTLSKAGSMGKTLAGGANIINKLAAGGRIDFPMVWKSSSYQPSYSMTVRLYNPNPQNDESTQKYIIGPIVAIMLLGVPRAYDKSTYTWPFLHRITCPGLFDLNPGFISNITVIKGGDQQQISFQQRLGIVDVRIDVGSLYSSMLAGSTNITSKRPTVLQYAESMAGKRKTTTKEEDDFSAKIDKNIVAKLPSPKISALAKLKEGVKTIGRIKSNSKDIYDELSRMKGIKL